MVDGFDMQGMPEQLGSLEFYEDCYDFLAQEGILVVNLHLNRPEHQECLARIQEVFGASTFEVVDNDMTIASCLRAKASASICWGQTRFAAPRPSPRMPGTSLCQPFALLPRP
jgi:spermidine synthase